MIKKISFLAVLILGNVNFIYSMDNNNNSTKKKKRSLAKAMSKKKKKTTNQGSASDLVQAISDRNRQKQQYTPQDISKSVKNGSVVRSNKGGTLYKVKREDNKKLPVTLTHKVAPSFIPKRIIKGNISSSNNSSTTLSYTHLASGKRVNINITETKNNSNG